MTQQSKAYYTVGAVGQTGRRGSEREQVTDHIPKKMMKCSSWKQQESVTEDWIDRMEVFCLSVTQS